MSQIPLFVVPLFVLWLNAVKVYFGDRNEGSMDLELNLGLLLSGCVRGGSLDSNSNPDFCKGESPLRDSCSMALANDFLIGNYPKMNLFSCSLS